MTHALCNEVDRWTRALAEVRHSYKHIKGIKSSYHCGLKQESQNEGQLIWHKYCTKETPGIISDKCSFSIDVLTGKSNIISCGLQALDWCNVNFKTDFVKSQVGAVIISRASNLYDPGSSPGLRTWAKIGPSQSEAKGFSPGTPVFLPLQIRLSRQYLNRRTIRH